MYGDTYGTLQVTSVGVLGPGRRTAFCWRRSRMRVLAVDVEGVEVVAHGVEWGRGGARYGQVSVHLSLNG